MIGTADGALPTSRGIFDGIEQNAESFFRNTHHLGSPILTIFEETTELILICGFYHLMHLIYLGMIEAEAQHIS
jgi:hypothetical protein